MRTTLAFGIMLLCSQDAFGQCSGPGCASGGYAGYPVSGAYGGAAYGYGMIEGGAPGQGAEQRYGFDSRDAWVHGYWQEIPSYGGHYTFRPYNYKHVLSQSQVSGGWGMSPTMPYSQEYFRRARERAIYDQHPPNPGYGRNAPSVGLLSRPPSAQAMRLSLPQE
jgi:hypothetical protein